MFLIKFCIFVLWCGRQFIFTLKRVGILTRWFFRPIYMALGKNLVDFAKFFMLNSKWFKDKIVFLNLLLLRWCIMSNKKDRDNVGNVIAAGATVATAATAATTASAVAGASAATIMSATAGTTGAALAGMAGASGLAGGATTASGMAAIGSVVGGGMAAGAVITAAAPVAAVGATIYGGYKLVSWLAQDK